MLRGFGERLGSDTGTETTPNQGSRALIMQQTRRGSFSPISKPIFAKHIFMLFYFETIFRDLQDRMIHKTYCRTISHSLTFVVRQDLHSQASQLSAQIAAARDAAKDAAADFAAADTDGDGMLSPPCASRAAHLEKKILSLGSRSLIFRPGPKILNSSDQ